MTRLVEEMRRVNKAFYTLVDLEKLYGLSRESLYVLLNRFVRSEQLIRLRGGVYILPERFRDLDVIANALYTPSYLSFESALSRHGLLSQIPASLTFATTRKSRRMTLSNTEIEYRKVKSSLFFGYTTGNGLLIAEPEKALLDALYMISRGKLMLKIEQLDLKVVRRTRLAKYAKKYPLGVRDRIRELTNA